MHGCAMRCAHGTVPPRGARHINFAIEALLKQLSACSANDTPPASSPASLGAATRVGRSGEGERVATPPVAPTSGAPIATRVADTSPTRRRLRQQQPHARTRGGGGEDVEAAARAAAAAAREKAKAHVARLLRLYFAQVPQPRRWQRTVLTPRFVLRPPAVSSHRLAFRRPLAATCGVRGPTV